MSLDVFLAGFGGALLVFALGALKEWWHRRRDRNGLLRVLFYEVSANHRSVGFLLTMFHTGNGKSAVELDGPHVSKEVWEATRVGLARYLRGRDLAVLTAYYASIPNLETASQISTSDTALETMRFILNRLDEQGIAAQEVIHRYVPDAEAIRIPEEDIPRLQEGRSFRELMADDEQPKRSTSVLGDLFTRRRGR